MKRRRKGGDEPPKPAAGNAWDGLRRQILELTPEATGIDAREGRTVYGAVMDWPVARAVATVEALAHGTASLYISTGGGVIGGGAHPAVAQAARTFILSLENYLPAMADDPDALPRQG